jgi:hypothetical protein
MNEAARSDAHDGIRAECAATNERVRVGMVDSAARSASASAHANSKRKSHARTKGGTASLVTGVAALLTIAVIALVGYFGLWLPSQTLNSQTRRTLMYEHRGNRIHASANHAYSLGKMEDRHSKDAAFETSSLETPGQQLEGDEN